MRDRSLFYRAQGIDAFKSDKFRHYCNLEGYHHTNFQRVVPLSIDDFKFPDDEKFKSKTVDMITQVFLQQEKNRQLSPENSSLYCSFDRSSYPITLFSPKQLYRQQLPLNRESLVAGEISLVLSALKQLKISLPPINDYPTALTSFF